jgi:hypothetical protein
MAKSFFLHPRLGVIFLLLYVSSACADLFDNRYLPLFGRPYTRTIDYPSNATADVFFTTADRAFDRNDNLIGNLELWGTYDQDKVANALVAIGLPNPLLPQWQGSNIIWRMGGKIQTQGFSFGWNQQITDYLSAGISGYVMRASGTQEFLFLSTESVLGLTTSDFLELDEIRRQMNNSLGLDGGVSHQSGFGDFDAYVRVGKIWEYILKCRRVDLGARFGVIVPSGNLINNNNPISVPFGGNGHWGFYFMADGEFEVKEDIYAGFWFRAGKRLTKIENRRMPVAGEPEPFGAIVGPVEISPGPFVMFMPYIGMENIREGLGARIILTVRSYSNDVWGDARPQAQQAAVPSQLNNVTESTGWKSDYITLNVFYDFGKVKVDRGLSPIIRLYWDIPTALLITERIPKTTQVSLGVEVKF